MNKFIYLLAVLFLMACSNDDGGGNGEEQEEMNEDPVLVDYNLGFDVSTDYFLDNEIGRIYVSNTDNEIVLQSELNNGQTYNFTVQGEEDEVFHLTYFRVLTLSGVAELSYMTTFTDFNFGSYNLSRENANNGFIDIAGDYINVGDLDPMETLFYSGEVSGGYTSQNGGTLDFNTVNYSGANYYVAIKNLNEGLPRFHFIENITSDVDLTIDFTQLDFASDSFVINYPDHSEKSYNIYGYKNYPQSLYGNPIRREQFVTNNSPASAFVSADTFDFFRLSGAYKTGGRKYIYYHVATELTHTLQIPSFDFDLGNSSLSSFAATTSGSYNIHTASYRATDDTTFNLSYRIIGESAASVNFSFSSIFDQILADNSSINSENLDFEEFSLSNFNGFSNYSDLVQDNFTISLFGDTISVGDFRESVSTDL